MTSHSTPAKTLLTQWARLLLESFAAAGVKEAVISPGSRSTPWVAAALQIPALRCTFTIDERAAAFYALGIAKASDFPPLLICTSGTAAANYFPAVIEAAHSYTPLLVLTADRPMELAHCHAPQTIDQIKLFGDYARAFFDLGAPDPAPAALMGLPRIASQAVFTSRSPIPGAVHLNVRARKPLEPSSLATEENERFIESVSWILEKPSPLAEVPSLAPGKRSLATLVESCRTFSKGLIVCGPAPMAQAKDREVIFELARRTGYPLLTEATSQLRFAPANVPRIGALDALGRCEAVRSRLRPELILQIGAPPVAAGWSQALDTWQECRRVVLAPHGWNDPWSSATALVSADVGLTLRQLLPHLAELGDEPGFQRRKSWNESWQEAESAARSIAIDLAANGEALTEGAIPPKIVEALPEGSFLALGNSLPIRQVDGYCPPQSKPLRVLCQRGASGIDGLLAGAAGAARALGSTGALLIGDVSFLHGLGGLACFRDLQQPFAIVVVNNDGGRIFEQLPLAQLESFQGDALDPWTTPHGLHFASAANLFELAYQRVESPSALENALHSAFLRKGACVIEATVAPNGAVEQNQALWREVDQRIARGTAGL